MVVTLLVLDALLTKPVDRIRISHAHERHGRLHELGVVLLDGFGSDGVLESQVDDSADDVFQMHQKVVESDKVKFGFNVSVLGKLVTVSASPDI